jgi:hypothetical protein
MVLQTVEQQSCYYIVHFVQYSKPHSRLFDVFQLEELGNKIGQACKEAVSEFYELRSEL